MKGSGLFVLSIVLLAACLATHAGAASDARSAVDSSFARDARLERVAALRSAIVLSHGKTTPENMRAWELEVETALAAEYGLTVIVDGPEVAVIDNALKARTEFIP